MRTQENIYKCEYRNHHRLCTCQCACPHPFTIYPGILTENIFYIRIAPYCDELLLSAIPPKDLYFNQFNVRMMSEELLLSESHIVSLTPIRILSMTQGSSVNLNRFIIITVYFCTGVMYQGFINTSSNYSPNYN